MLKRYVSEGAGTVRLTVRRVQGGDSHAVIFYSTEDGTALASYDYEPSSGYLCFKKGEMSKEIKILIIDDELVEEMYDNLSAICSNARSKNISLIICGDFNADPEKLQGIMTLVEEEGWIDVGLHADWWGGPPAATTC